MLLLWALHYWFNVKLFLLNSYAGFSPLLPDGNGHTSCFWLQAPCRPFFSRQQFLKMPLESYCLGPRQSVQKVNQVVVSVSLNESWEIYDDLLCVTWCRSGQISTMCADSWGLQWKHTGLWMQTVVYLCLSCLSMIYSKRRKKKLLQTEPFKISVF